MPTPRCLLLIALVLRATSAWAEEPEPSGSDVAAAEVLFQKGRDAMDGGDLEKAREAFRESQRLDAAAGTVMNLAVVEEKLGKLASAWEHWQHASRLLDDDDKRRPFVEKKIGDLEMTLPRLSIVPKGAEGADLEIERNGVALGSASWGVALPVDPGTVTVVVSAPHHQPRTYEIDVFVGETKELEVAPGKELPEARDVGTPSSSPLRTAGFVAGGVGIAGLGLGVVSAALLPGTKSTVEENCPAGQCNAEGWSAVQRGKTLLTLNTVGFIVGGVGLITGTTLVIVSRKESDERDSAKASKKRTADLWVSPDGAGIAYGGRF